ncbi:MAG: D-alanyl-D-alanine carboxypeptidase/D-alanyl-D-alanine-endopeptidase [Muribaculaceae bacterium]|nr:D-alanyl-D-alanine carboxypeptidase/D-alanyl-D-alanine-endopeptidase [Muribaculaceae bacterium]
MKYLLRILTFALPVLACATASAANILGLDGEESTSVGIYIKEIGQEGRVLLDHNSQMALTPASVMKAITTATVLSLEGANRRFETTVSLRGSRGDGGAWHGDLVVRSCADPTLESDNFRSNKGFCDSIVANLRRRGIRRIDGKVLIEESLKDAGPILQWEAEDIAWPYGAGLFGFNWRDNIVSVTPLTGKIEPAAPGLEIEVRPSDGGNDLVRGVYSNKLTVFTNSRDRRWTINVTVPDPAAVFGAQLERKLADAGISVGGADGLSDENSEASTVYIHRSPRFADIMRSLMVRSDNLFAEGMLRTLAPTGRRRDAINREKELWATRGINSRYTIINDGSGLTRANRLSAHFIGDVLEWMATSPNADTYCGFFPRAGREGTLRGFLSRSRLKGKIALKTGSVSAVQCYAGYKFNDAGRPTHIIVILVNGFFCPRSQVRRGAEHLLEQTF